MTYEQVRQRIAELVPDIKKLEFGCYVLDESQNIPCRLVRQIVYTTWQDEFGKEYEPIEPFCKILGRDPSLADVLRALKVLHPKSFATDMNGLDYDDGTVTYERKSLGLIRKWDLSKPLSGQSQETITFLGELIKDH